VIYVQRTFRLQAPSGLGRYPRPELIGPLLTDLPQTLQDAVRMGFLHSSRAPGRISDALRAAADVQFVGIDADGDNGTAVTFRVPRFGAAAPSLFEQGKFWDDAPASEATAFDLLGDVLRDVQAERSDSSHFDQPLLKRIGSYGRLLKQGVARISLDDGGDAAPRIDADVVRRAIALSRATPAARRVRVAGRLDLMGASQGVLKLHVRPNEIVTALWNGSERLESHSGLFNRDVVIEGLGVFRPSGSLLRIEADALAPAGRQDDFFREAPVAVPAGQDFLAMARLRPGERSAYAAIRGVVPADESDADFAAAVDEFS
jgi:hypothetical protein